MAVKKFPKEVNVFKPETKHYHPESYLICDILKRAGQNILVTTDMFSGFTSACIVNSEVKDDLIRGLLLTTTPLRHSNIVVVRTDQATAFQSLENVKHPELERNGIILELGRDCNTNSNTIVDRRIQGLEI